ncbi:unnamed protein product [Oreochromis niloticus]|nr:unnamed protein product [Mustela putorius furo]
MAGNASQTCLECGIPMPLDDGHEHCVLCLGPEHALLAREAPASCMNRFILPVRTGEARARFFSVKRPAPPLSQASQAKVRKIAAADVESSPAAPWAGSPSPFIDLLGPSRAFPFCGPASEPVPLDVDYGEADVDEASILCSDASRLSPEVPPAGSPGTESGQLSFFQLLERACQALELSLPEVPVSAPSRFDDASRPQRSLSQVLLLPDFQDLLCKQFEAPPALHHWSPACKRFSATHGQERIACGPLPPVDPSLAPLVAPSGSLLGRAACPNRDVKTMDGLLARLHRSMATRACLSNSLAILSLHLRHLACQLQANSDDLEGVEELLSTSSLLASLMKHQAIATGSSLAAFWVARRHLWLSQSRLRSDDQDCLMRLPVDPAAMFGPSAAQLLQQAMETRRAMQEMSRGLRRRLAKISGPSWRPFVGAAAALRLGEGAGVPRDSHPAAVPLLPDVSPGQAALPASLATEQRRVAWSALWADPWVVSTIGQGYRFQFCRRPPLTSTPTFTSVADPEQCRSHVALLVSHIQALGLRLNLKKSSLEPSQTTTFLGMSLDSARALVSLMADRQRVLRVCLASFSLHSRVRWGLCLRLMGWMDPLALLQMRPVQQRLLSLGLCPQQSHLSTVLVSRGLARALRWWRDPVNLQQGQAMGPVTRRQVVFSDASPVGWGAVHEGCGVSGRWSGPWLSRHINVLELRAAFLPLQLFSPRLQGFHVTVRMDSTMAAAYINCQGGLGSPPLCNMATRLWLWAHPRFLSLRAVHVPGPLNTAADMLSRGGPCPGEWRLHPQIYSQGLRLRQIDMIDDEVTGSSRTLSSMARHI